MIVKKLKINNTNQKGFTMIEIMAYLFITSILLLLIISLIINIFNARRQFRANELVDRNSRYILNFVLNKVHNVDLIDKTGEGLSDIYFYDLPDQRFNFSEESNNLVFRLVSDEGSGFPDQNTAIAQNLNFNGVKVSNFILNPLKDNFNQDNRGVQFSFTLTVGTSTDSYGFVQEDFSTFFSIR